MKIIRIKAMWCSGCLAMRKIWNKVDESYPNLDYMDLDYDMDEEAVQPYNPGTILPVTIFCDDDMEELYRLNGERKVEEIIKVIEEYK